MPVNDEHDPLDSWLNQQVRPLPPPPGTFELITRRARRRKLRKLAVTVASAAAVAAAVAVAVPNIIALNITPSHETGNSVAIGRSSTPSGGGTQSANGSASPYASPTTSSPSPVTEPSGPVPANFQPSSVTFVSPSVGWVIGQAGTPGKCYNANPDVCTSIARTNDAGKTWQGGPAPSTTGPSGAQGVSGLRFLDGVSGWAFGPELWATHDAGRTWTKVDTDGQRVTDLETAGDRAYALFATCTGTNAHSFAMNCTSFTLMTTIATSDDWVPVSTATSDLTDGGSATSAVLALTGSAGYLLAPDGTLYSGPLGGTWQRAGTAPCKPGTPQADGLPGDAWLALVDSAHLAMNCQGTSATSPPEVYTSGDSGKTWQRSGAAWSGISGFGIVTSFAAAPDGTRVLASTRGLYVLPAGGSASGAQWKPAAEPPAGGFSYVGMTTDSQGIALPADTSLHEIWMTFDGGLTWAPRTSITPGN
ncbi:MAG TPA: hypothetical protein VKG80_22160 [Trebonia sp.]|nr:hypothetical protein [Trebonia sp.]